MSPGWDEAVEPSPLPDITIDEATTQVDALASQDEADGNAVPTNGHKTVPRMASDQPEAGMQVLIEDGLVTLVFSERATARLVNIDHAHLSCTLRRQNGCLLPGVVSITAHGNTTAMDYAKEPEDSAIHMLIESVTLDACRFTLNSRIDPRATKLLQEHPDHALVA